MVYKYINNVGVSTEGIKEVVKEATDEATALVKS